MLVLSRQIGEKLVIEAGGHTLTISVDKVTPSASGPRLKYAIDAPPEVRVWREELYRERQAGLQTRPPSTGTHS